MHYLSDDKCEAWLDFGRQDGRVTCELNPLHGGQHEAHTVPAKQSGPGIVEATVLW